MLTTKLQTLNQTPLKLRDAGVIQYIHPIPNCRKKSKARADKNNKIIIFKNTNLNKKTNPIIMSQNLINNQKYPQITNNLHQNETNKINFNQK